MRSNKILNWKSLLWKRPDEIYGKGNYCLFNEIKPDSVVQGQLNDSYFLSCISSLAEIPQRIKDLFLIQKINS